MFYFEETEKLMQFLSVETPCTYLKFKREHLSHSGMTFLRLLKSL